MDKELLQYIEANQDIFRLQIKMNARLQSSSDILKPIIPAFLESNKGVNLEGCPECILDMLRWSIKELKESKESKPKKDVGK